MEPLGVSYYQQHRRGHLPISQLAKRIARFVCHHATLKGASVRSEEICSELEITRESYLHAVGELAEFELIEEMVNIDQEPLRTVNLTAKGRHAVRTGFKRETPGATQ